jgi:hypothetical protein
MNEPQTFETHGGGTESFQIRYHDAFVVADYYSRNFSFAADEQADLTVDFAGEKGQLTGKILSNYIFWRNAFVSQTLYLLDLRGAQSCRISSNFINR